MEVTKDNTEKTQSEKAKRRVKARKLLELSDMNSMEDILPLFRDTIVMFIESSL